MPGATVSTETLTKKPLNSRIDVLAVVATVGTTAYLQETLSALAKQTYAPSVLLVVDTASRENGLGSGIPVEEIIAQAEVDQRCPVRVVRAPEATNFGDAVKRGLKLYTELISAGNKRRPHNAQHNPNLHSANWTGPTGALSPITTMEMQTVANSHEPTAKPASQSWLWLLHDDSAPEPHCLEELVAAVSSARSVALAGVKQVDWDDPRHLLEVGNRTTASARRANDIVEGELDQGQYDTRSDVLAVGTAGAFIKREVWDAIGGTSPVFGPFGDGLELSRVVRLADHRVIVVPKAVVRHRRAAYLGLRSKNPDPRAVTTQLTEPKTHTAAHHSFRSRRIAQLRNWAIFSSLHNMLFLGMHMLVLGFARAAWRLLSGEPALARDEVKAAITVVSNPQVIASGRRRVSKNAVASRSALSELYLHPRDIRAYRRDHRRQERERLAREAVPSELELSEKAALARRRRLGLALALLFTTVVGAVGLHSVIMTRSLAGGALPALDLSWQEIWQQARASWLASGDGYASLSSPLLMVLTALLLPTGLLGMSSAQTLHILLISSPILAALGAWFATGVLTRRVSLRTWGTIFWVAAPSFLLALGQGRLAAVGVHVLLPLVLLSLGKALGADRRDVIISGLVGAKHLSAQELAELTRRPKAQMEQLGQLLREGVTEEADEEQPATEKSSVPEPSPATQPYSPQREAAPEQFGCGSIAAAGVSGILLFALTALAPASAPITLIFLALAVWTHRRYYARLLVAAWPVIAAALPTYLQASKQTSWSSAIQLLLTDAGAPLAITGPGTDDLLAGIPLSLGSLAVPGILVLVAKLAGLALLALAALAAFFPGRNGTRARIGFFAGALGLGLATLSAHTVTTVGSTAAGSPTAISAWAGTGLSLATAGWLTAALAGGDSLHQLLTKYSFGWRHVSLAVLSVLALLAPLALGVGWAWMATGEDTSQVMSLETASQQIPLIADETQNSATRGRVLSISADENGISAALWRQAGTGIVDTMPAVLHSQFLNSLETAQVPSFLTHSDDAEKWYSQTLSYTDPADSELLEALSLALTGNEAEAADLLAAHNISVVLVQDNSGDETTAAAVAALDSTAGLDRLANTSTGTSWRVTPSSGSESARAILTSATDTLTVPAEVTGINTTISESSNGSERTLILSERADSNWHATLDGVALESTTLYSSQVGSWRQAFIVPADGGQLVVTHTDPAVGAVTWNVWLSLILAGLTALPLRRRSTR